MQNSIDACRWVYNKTLEVRRDAWKERQESLSLYETNTMLTQWKKENPLLYNTFSQCLQQAQSRVDLAYKAFFRRVKAGQKPGYPRFKSEDRYDSFSFPQLGFALVGGKLRLSKIGMVKIRLHRPICGKIKTLNVNRNHLGNWFACFSCEVDPENLPPTTSILGIDVGLESFATLSTGEKIENPRFFRKDEKALAQAQRKGKKRAAQHIHQRIANRRKDFAHKLSRRLVNENQFIAFEDLNIQNMLSNRHFAKSIADAAWNQLIRYTTYKAEDAGRRVILVDPRNTSKMCSRCGTMVDKDLSVRVHSCPHCSLELDRDHNAALNILARGLTCISNQSVKVPAK